MQSAWQALNQRRMNFITMKMAIQKMVDVVQDNMVRPAFERIVTGDVMDPERASAIQMFVERISRANRERCGFVMEKWSCRNEKSKLRKLLRNLNNHHALLLRNALNRCQMQIRSQKIVSKMMALMRIPRLNAIIEQMGLRRSVNRWRNTKPTNVWFSRVANMIAKNSKINLQVSLWRMRDNIHSIGGALSALKIVKCKKMFNNINKVYWLMIAKAFWTIEGVGRADYYSEIHSRHAASNHITPRESISLNPMMLSNGAMKVRI